MGSIRYTGNAPAVAQSGTVQITSYDSATTYKLTTGGGKVISALAAGSVNGTASSLAAAVNASTFPEVSGVDGFSASASGDTITFTAHTGGTPFSVTSSVSGGTGTIGAYTAVTANSSPSDLTDTRNYDTGALPVNGDDLYLDNLDTPILWNLTGLSGVLLNSLTKAASFTQPVGLPLANPSGYAEWRPTELTIGVTTLVYGTGAGNDSGRFKLNTGSVQTSILILRTGSGTETNLETFLWRGTHASNSITVEGGSLGIAVFNGQAATVNTLNVSGGGRVRLGSNVTLGTGRNDGGTLDVNGGTFSTFNQTGGTSTFYAGSVTTMNADGGTVNWRTTGTLTTCNVSLGGAATVDLSADNRSKTVTTVTLYAGATWLDPSAKGLPANGFSCKAGLDRITLSVGADRLLTVT